MKNMYDILCYIIKVWLLLILNNINFRTKKPRKNSDDLNDEPIDKNSLNITIENPRKYLKQKQEYKTIRHTAAKKQTIK